MMGHTSAVCMSLCPVPEERIIISPVHILLQFTQFGGKSVTTPPDHENKYPLVRGPVPTQVPCKMMVGMASWRGAI